MFLIGTQVIQLRSMLAIVSCTALIIVSAWPSQAKVEVSQPVSTPISLD